ncbi:TetR/AcrR family transcriptional regulator [Promicromonospora sukumoe]|uniref:TetR/AcrR family transcriptional regulator n=1 Tax=Promicromonospora sukumoe TaxID=88382 RepID=UPI0036558E62
MRPVTEPEQPAAGGPAEGGAPPSADDVPAHLARLWRLPSGSHLGRRPVLDVDQVVAAAVGLADRDGLAGVTLPKVAGELGVTPMSLYRYVGSKDELLALMGDHGSRPAGDGEAGGGAPDAPGDPAWRVALRRWAYGVRAMYVRHPWLAHLPVQGPPSGPHELARLDSGLAALRGTGLDWAAKVGVVTLVSGYVRTAAQLAADMSRARAGSGLDQGQAEQEYGRAMARLVRPERYPEAARLFGSGLFEQEPPPGVAAEGPDHDFRFGLETVLDGVGAAVDRAGPSPAP